MNETQKRDEFMRRINDWLELNPSPNHRPMMTQFAGELVFGDYHLYDFKRVMQELSTLEKSVWRMFGEELLDQMRKNSDRFDAVDTEWLETALRMNDSAAKAHFVSENLPDET